MPGSFKNSKMAVILGPTCTGKTLLATGLCKRFNGAIISADSRQVVRYMDIGTGKLPAGESDREIDRRDGRWTVDGIDIFGYDLVNPDEYFSAYDFVKYCQKTIPRIKEKIIFIVGGTGFYIDAVTGRMALAGVSPDTELRQSLESLSTEELAEKLLELDESIYKTVDIKNPARLVRAIEKASQFYGVPRRFEERAVRSGTRDENAAEPLFIGLTANREVLYSRADKWVDAIFTEKLFEEVKFIQTRFPKSHRLNGLIYKSAVDYLNGETDLGESEQRAKFDMHAYIRRQQTWFKRNPKIRWFDISQKNFDADVTSIVKSLVNG